MATLYSPSTMNLQKFIMTLSPGQFLSMSMRKRMRMLKFIVWPMATTTTNIENKVFSCVSSSISMNFTNLQTNRQTPGLQKDRYRGTSGTKEGLTSIGRFREKIAYLARLSCIQGQKEVKTVQVRCKKAVSQYHL